VNTFLLRSPAAQESPAQTSLFGRSPGCESSLDFRYGLAPVGSTPASLPARLSNQTTRPFNQSFTGLDDVVLILLLTGVPGIGKTTIIKRLVGRLTEFTVNGFYTEEIRNGIQRVGFRLIGLRGPSGVIAHVDFDCPHRVGRNKVEVAKIDYLANANLAAVDAELTLIDEIGKIECLSPAFVSRIKTILEAGGPLVATIAKKGGGFIEEIKHRSDCELWEVTLQNRNHMPEKVLFWLMQRGIIRADS